MPPRKEGKPPLIDIEHKKNSPLGKEFQLLFLRLLAVRTDILTIFGRGLDKF